MVYDDIHQHWRLSGHEFGPIISACRYGLGFVVSDLNTIMGTVSLFAAPIFGTDWASDHFFNQYGASPIHLLSHWVGYYDLKYDFAQWVKAYLSPSLGMVIERL